MWEYKTLFVAGGDAQGDEKFQKLGLNGWELVSVVVIDNDYREDRQAGFALFFKRSIRTKSKAIDDPENFERLMTLFSI